MVGPCVQQSCQQDFSRYCGLVFASWVIFTLQYEIKCNSCFWPSFFSSCSQLLQQHKLSNSKFLLTQQTNQDEEVIVKSTGEKTVITNKPPSASVKAFGSSLFYGSFVKVLQRLHVALGSHVFLFIVCLFQMRCSTFFISFI